MLYIPIEGELRAVRVTKALADGAYDYAGDGVAGFGCRLPITDETSAPVAPAEAYRRTLRERAEETYALMQSGGCMDALLAAKDKLDRLVRVLEGVPSLAGLLRGLEDMYD